MKINKEDLEKALNKVRDGSEEEKHNCGDDCKCDTNEEIGFHKGALNTLAAERNELFKMLQNVEAIMQVHLKRLEELGVKIPKKRIDS